MRVSHSQAREDKGDGGMVELVLLRHGQSESNRGGIHQGWSATPLTVIGRQQAAAVRRVLRNSRFDRIYSSDLPRTEETAHIVFPPPAEIIWEPLLRELHCGQVSGLTAREARKRFGSAYSQCEAANDWRGLQGESGDMLEERLEKFLDALREAMPQGRVAIVTHGGPIKALVCLALNAPFAQARRVLSIDNASMTILQWEPPRWVVRTVNNTAHLSREEMMAEVALK